MNKKVHAHLSIIALPFIILSNSAHAIYGGQETTPHSTPSAVFIANQGYTCTGVLIGPKAILTSALCASTQDDTLTFLMGAHQISANEASQVEVNFGYDIIPHKQFNSLNLDNNISIIKLHETVSFNESISSISLGNVSLNAPATIFGWGSTSKGDRSASEVLHMAPQNITDDSLCDAHFNEATSTAMKVSFNNKICVNSNNVAPQDGDLGAPLIQNGKLIGLWSFGGIDNKFQVYTDISKYLDWINTNR